MGYVLRSALVTAICIIAGFSAASAQLTMFLAQQGISDASLHAAQNFAPDAQLVLIGALGDTSLDGGAGLVNLRFDLATGRANAWAYAFRSAQKNAIATYVVIDIPGFGRQVFDGFVPGDVPVAAQTVMATSAPYFGSDKLVERLKMESTYAAYRASLPGKRPRLIGLRKLVAEDVTVLPEGFAIGVPTWYVEFAGGKDTAMECYVSAETGATFCRRASAVAGVKEEDRAEARCVVTATSPADGAYTVSIRSGNRPTVSIHALDGRLVRECSSLENRGERWEAGIDLRDLPTGMYFCRVGGDGRVDTIRLPR